MVKFGFDTKLRNFFDESPDFFLNLFNFFLNIFPNKVSLLCKALRLVKLDKPLDAYLF